MAQSSYLILSCDGGGIRGLIPALLVRNSTRNSIKNLPQRAQSPRKDAQGNFPLRLFAVLLRVLCGLDFRFERDHADHHLIVY